MRGERARTQPRVQVKLTAESMAGRGGGGGPEAARAGWAVVDGVVSISTVTGSKGHEVRHVAGVRSSEFAICI